MPDGERERKLARLVSGETEVLFNCGVLLEGWDCPVASCIILARPTKSRGLFKQMAGRILRPAPGKEFAMILDHAGITATHGFITDPDQYSLHDGLGKIKEAKPRTCRECGAEFYGAPKFCPQCGAPVPPGEAREIRHDPNAEIEELTPQGIWRDWYRRRAEEGYWSGKQPGWLAHKFRDKFGRWPNYLDAVGATIKTKWKSGGKGVSVWVNSEGEELPPQAKSFWARPESQEMIQRARMEAEPEASAV
jgi:hypothetical protein